MKKLFLIIITIFILAMFCSCEEKEEINYDEPNTYIVLDVQEDTYGNVISKTVYNKIAEDTYTYTYTYEYDNGMWVCSDVHLVVVSRSGYVIYAGSEK